MLLRFAVFAMMALGLGGFGTVTWLALRTPQAAAPAATALAAPPPVLRHLVLAAAGALHAGALLKPDDLAALEVTQAPAGAQEDTVAMRAGLVGAMLRRSLVANAPLLAPDVLRPGDHGFLAAVLAPGLRAASVAVDAVSGSAGLIWPGDHVDLILTQTLDNPALPAAHKIAAETVLSDVRVIAIDQLLVRGVAPATEQAGSGRTVTVEVTGLDAERIAVATRLGRLSLAVRAAEEPPQGVPSLGPPGRILTTWGGDVSPALGLPVPAAGSGASMRLYQGAAEGKEIRF